MSLLTNLIWGFVRSTSSALLGRVAAPLDTCCLGEGTTNHWHDAVEWHSWFFPCLHEHSKYSDHECAFPPPLRQSWKKESQSQRLLIMIAGPICRACIDEL